MLKREAPRCKSPMCGQGRGKGRCGKYSADCWEEPKKESTLADLLSVFLAQGHPGGGYRFDRCPPASARGQRTADVFGSQC